MSNDKEWRYSFNLTLIKAPDETKSQYAYRYIINIGYQIRNQINQWRKDLR